MAMSAEHRSKFLEWEDKQTNKQRVCNGQFEANNVYDVLCWSDDSFKSGKTTTFLEITFKNLQI